MARQSLIELVGGVVPVREARYVPTICDGNTPLEGPDQALHVDLTEARGGDRIAEIEQAIRWAPPGRYEKRLLTGHSGSGKSTELFRLQTMLQKNKEDRVFHVVFFDVMHHLDPSDIQLPDLVAALFLALWQDPVLNLPKMPTAKLLLEELLAVAKAIGSDVGADLAKSIPGLGSMLKNADFQRRFREKSWDTTARIIEQIGDLLQEVRTALVAQEDIEDLVIVIDNLEKMLCRDVGHGQTNHDLLFIEQLPKLEALPVHMVITFPVSLHADQVRLRTTYASASTMQIPMVLVRRRLGHGPDPKGIEVLKAFLDRRLDRGVIFQDDETIEEAIQASGGCVRDLLRIVSGAVLHRGSVPIGKDDVSQAIRSEVSDFERVLQGREYLADLHSIEATGDIPTTLSNDLRKKLLLELIVLEYDGETWYDVHPFARRTRAFIQSAPQSGPPVLPP